MKGRIVVFRRLVAFTGTISLFATWLAVLIVPAPAYARQPVSQCTGPGQALSAQSASASSQQMMTASSETGEMPDGRVLPVEPNMAAFRPTVRTSANVGSVNLKTGAFSYTNEDISVGQGEFPARLHLSRTYSSDRATSDNGSYPWFSPAAPEIHPFGIASTHNLDIRFRTGKQVFTGTIPGPAYDMFYISFGFSTLAFQKCADGAYVSAYRDGARLFADSTYSSGGYRLELGDGTKLYLMSFSRNTCVPEYSYADTQCGGIQRWESPNGDWANFAYQQYYDKPDSAINSHLDQYYRIDNYQNTEQLCITTPTVQNDCRDIDSTYYFVHSEDLEDRLNNAMMAMRLVQITTSRNYRAEFSYVDSTTNIGSICPQLNHLGGLDCLPPANELQQRSLIKDVKIYAGSTLLREVSYTYGGLNLSTYTGPDGRNITYEFSAADPTAPTYKIYEGNSLSLPITTVNFVLANGALFQQPPTSYYLPQSGYTPHAYSKYPRVSSQVFADGRTVQYVPTFASKWVTDTEMTAGQPRTNWRPVEYISEMRVVEPGNRVSVFRFDDEDRPVLATNPLNSSVANEYDDVGKILATTNPEGGRTAYTYDVRGNVLSVTHHPKPASGLNPLTETRSYVGGATLPANSCANQRTCNRPQTSTDARGFTTDYAWDADSGMMSSITGPADPAGVRPITSYGYANYPGPVSGTLRMLTSKTERIGATQNVVTNYGYDSANRYFPREILQDVGGLNLRTCMTFDQAGAPISQTSPNANLTSCP